MRSHKKYMEMAIKLAERGRGGVSPNPMVGAIITKRNQIVGKGYHKRAGDVHAEIAALEMAQKKSSGGTLYVTLEPCSHWGKTPPCTERIVQAGIREVIIGMKDPNPAVTGYEELKFRGIKTKIGILEGECKKLNESYIAFQTHKRPHFTLKAATSLDGQIATSSGDSKYITCKEARKFVHEIRSRVDAVMVGINTIIKDNPRLDVRLVDGRNPVRIIVDTRLRLPENAKALKNPEQVIIATTSKAPKTKVKRLQQKGINILQVKLKNSRVDLKSLAAELAKLEITSVMIEGGAKLSAQAIREGIVDKILFFISPSVIGKGLSALGDLGIKKIDKRINLKDVDSRKVGRDILIEGYL